MEDNQMKLEFTVQTRIQKPVAEVFDAVYNPEKMVKYFAQASVKGALDEGATAYWQFDHDENNRNPIRVQVKKMEKNKRIVFEWIANEDGVMHSDREDAYNTTVEMTFEALSDRETLIKITESGWRENAAALAGSYQNCNGWTQMMASLKTWIEHGYALGMDGCGASR